MGDQIASPGPQVGEPEGKSAPPSIANAPPATGDLGVKGPVQPPDSQQAACGAGQVAPPPASSLGVKGPVQSPESPQAKSGGEFAPRPTDGLGVKGPRQPAEKSGPSPVSGLTITHLPDRIGFQRDSAAVSGQDVGRFLKSLPPESRALLDNPDAAVFIKGLADRTGAEEHNLNLSKDRADHVAAELKKLGVKAQIITSYEGEGLANDLGEPDGKDNPDFRSAKIDVVGPLPPPVADAGRLTDSQINHLAKSLTDGVPDLSKSDSIKELKDRAITTAKTAKELIDHVLHLDPRSVVDIEKVMFGLWVDGLQHAQYRENVSGNLIPAYLQTLERSLGGRPLSREPLIRQMPWIYNERQQTVGAKYIEIGEVLAEQEIQKQKQAPSQLDVMRRTFSDYDTQLRIERATEQILQQKLNH